MFYFKNFKKRLQLAIVASFTMYASLGTVQPDTFLSPMHEIANLYTKSLVANQQKNSIVDSTHNLSLQLQQPSRNQMLLLAMNELQKIQLDTDQKTTLDRLFFRKMELFCDDEQSGNHLLNIIDNTETVFGNLMLAQQIAQPRFNVNALHSIQHIIQTLISDREISTTLQKQLEILKENEPYFLSYFEEYNTVNEEIFKKVYWGKRLNFLNSNEWTLELGVQLGNLGNLFSISALPLSLAMIAAEMRLIKGLLSEEQVTFKESFLLGIKGLVNPHTDSYKDGGVQKLKNNIVDSWHKIQDLTNTYHQKAKDFNTKSMNEEIRNVLRSEIADLQKQMESASKQFTNELFGFIPQSAGDIAHLINSTQGTPKIVSLAIVGSLVALQTYNSYKAFADAKLKQDIYNHLQTKLIGIAKYISALKDLATLIQNYGISFPGQTELFTLSHMQGLSSDCQKLLRLLDASTFTGKASSFSLTGRILKAHTLMQKVKEELIPASAAAGQLDAYLSTAKLYNKHQNTPAQFCFVAFDTNSSQPYVRAQEFWNLFIDATTVVTNSIELGVHAPNNIILTGPNTGGKSTIIKGLLLNILLAQTLGIASAKELTLTPFAHLNCYLNITDDLTAGVSLFKAEVLRAKALINAVRNLKNDEFSFTIIDEVFSGTSPIEGEEAAIHFAQELGSLSNSICSIATHFPRLTSELPSDQFKNYQVTVYKDAENNWVRPFTLEEGASSINIAMDLLKEEGIFKE